MIMLFHLLYFIALITMFVSVVFLFLTTYPNRIIPYLLILLSSSYIIFSKTYDWVIVLALKRKNIDKQLGVNTGCYFKTLMIVCFGAYILSGIYIFRYIHDTSTILYLCIFYTFTSLSYIINIFRAHKADPDKVLEEIQNR